MLLSQPILAPVSFTALYLLCTYYLTRVCSQDPTSAFFDPRQAYTPAYSTIRREEAEAFIFSGTNTSQYPPRRNQTLCVGIPSVQREGAQYLGTAVGSLLSGLTPMERANIHLIVLIPHTNPFVHPAYSQTWLSHTADDVLVYDHLSNEALEHLANLEVKDHLFREKGLFDYNYLLSACYARDTPYIVMLEDDVVAMDGWYHRTMAALRQAERLTARNKGSPNDFLYLRLFYTEEFLGWNAEEWPIYLAWSLLCVVALATLLLSIRSSATAPLRRQLSNRAIVGLCGLCLPMLIGLFFAAGRVTVLPLPPGVNKMSRFGCCSQALVFPRAKAMDLMEYYTNKKTGFVDMLTEEYADERGELRWTLTPSVIQHIGRKSSKGDDFGSAAKYERSVAEKIWNFAFERNDAGELRAEHARVAGAEKEDKTLLGEDRSK